MRESAAGTVAIARDVFVEMRDRDITFMAASLAYYAFISLFPMLMLALVTVSFFWNHEMARQLVTIVGSILTAEATDLVMESMTEAPGRGGATVASVVILLWSTLKLFRGLDHAFSRVYRVGEEPSFAQQLVNALTALVAITVGVAAMIVVITVFGSVARGLVRILGPFALFVALSIVFLPLYYVFPGVDMTVQGALPGAITAAGGWTILQILFSVYAENAGAYALFGVLGAVLLVLTWLYIGSLLLLLGAALNVVLAKYDGRIEEQPDDGRRVVGEPRGDGGRAVGERTGENGEGIDDRSRTTGNYNRKDDDMSPQGKQ